MNGYGATILLAIAQGLGYVFILLLGVIWKMHQHGDEEHRLRMDKEIDALRSRMHDAMDEISGLKAKEYMRDKHDAD